VKTQISLAEIRTIARVVEFRSESRRGFGVPFPSWATSTKLSRGSGTVHRTKNRKIESSEEISRKTSENLEEIGVKIEEKSRFLERKSEKIEKIREKSRIFSEKSKKIVKSREEA
jgi:hypothetical protein